ncbi:MAG TPA: o-succinylbenzoate synthase [Ignavibacteriales bacterium]|nr:o-succinylbenzoate synthase [Ignavibacteriales bacterium]
MSVLKIKYIPYGIKFTSPFVTSKGAVERRRGFFICINETAWGEAAPFPEFGSESYIESEAALKELFGLSEGEVCELTRDSFEGKLQSLNFLPALRHGLEQAYLNFRSLSEKTSLEKILGVKLSPGINVNGLIGLVSPEEALGKALELTKKGFTTLKLKAGRNDFNLDKKSLELLRNNLSPKVKLRIDVNGKWEPSQAVAYIKELEEYGLEYIEQPVRGKEDFFQLAALSKVPLAADEIVRNAGDASEVIRRSPESVLILKPMMLGGIARTLSIIKEAEASGVKTVISSSFETSLGLSAAVFLALSQKSDTAHGLGTQGFLESDPFGDFPEVKGGIIESQSSIFTDPSFKYKI